MAVSYNPDTNSSRAVVACFHEDVSPEGFDWTEIAGPWVCEICQMYEEYDGPEEPEDADEVELDQ